MHDDAVDSAPKPLAQLKGIAPVAFLLRSKALQANCGAPPTRGLNRPLNECILPVRLRSGTRVVRSVEGTELIDVDEAARAGTTRHVGSRDDLPYSPGRETACGLLPVQPRTDALYVVPVVCCSPVLFVFVSGERSVGTVWFGAAARRRLGTPSPRESMERRTDVHREPERLFGLKSPYLQGRES